MKKLVEGNELYNYVPKCQITGNEPVVRLQHNLILDDGNCFESPTLILGNVGSGKSTIMGEVQDVIFPYARKVKDSVVTFCAKPEMLRYAKPGDIVISITNMEPASCWNVFDEMNASNNPSLTLREIATELFAEVEDKTMQLFFPQAARDILYKTGNYMNNYALRKYIHFTNADLVEFLETTPIHGSEDNPGWVELAELFPEDFGMLRDYLGNGSEQGLGCLSELRTMISRTLFGCFISDKGTFSAIRTLKEGGRNVFLYYDYANSGHSTLSVFHIILDLLLKQAMNSKVNHKTWFFLDEASLLPKSNVLMDALSLGRDPGSNGKGGVRIIMALQSARLMTHQYTYQEAETLLSLFPNVIAMRVSDPFSRAVVSERYGKAHYQYSYGGVGDKVHYHDSIEDVVSDYHFSQLTKKGQAIVSMPGISEHPFIYDGYRKKG